MEHKTRMSTGQAVATTLGAAAWILSGLLGVVAVAAYDGPSDAASTFGYAMYFLFVGGMAVVIGLAAAVCLLACVLAGQRLRPTSWLAAGVPGVAAVAACVWLALA